MSETRTAQAIKKWRERNELSPEDVASAAAVSRQTVYNWENGDVDPRVGQLVALEKRWPGLLRMMGLAAS